MPPFLICGTGYVTPPEGNRTTRCREGPRMLAAAAKACAVSAKMGRAGKVAPALASSGQTMRIGFRCSAARGHADKERRIAGQVRRQPHDELRQVLRAQHAENRSRGLLSQRPADRLDAVEPAGTPRQADHHAARPRRPERVGDPLERLPQVEVARVGVGDQDIRRRRHDHAAGDGGLLGEHAVRGQDLAGGDGTGKLAPVQEVLHREGRAVGLVHHCPGGVDRLSHGVLEHVGADMLLERAPHAHEVKRADRIDGRAARDEHLVSTAEARLKVRRDARDQDAQVGGDQPRVDGDGQVSYGAQARPAGAAASHVAAAGDAGKFRPELGGGLGLRQRRVHAGGEKDFDLLVGDLGVTDFAQDQRKNLRQGAVAGQVLHDDEDFSAPARGQQPGQRQPRLRLIERQGHSVGPVVRGRAQGGTGRLDHLPMVRERELQRTIAPWHGQLRHFDLVLVRPSTMPRLDANASLNTADLFPVSPT